VQTSCDPLGQPRHSRQRCCRNCTTTACFAASRAKKTMNGWLTRRREDAKESHGTCKHHAIHSAGHGTAGNAAAATAPHQPASRLRGFACKKHNERLTHAKTRRRERIARKAQTSCDPLGQPRPSRQGTPSIAPPNLLRGFAASRAKNAMNGGLTRRREDAKASHGTCKHHAIHSASRGPAGKATPQ